MLCRRGRGRSFHVKGPKTPVESLKVKSSLAVTVGTERASQPAAHHRGRVAVAATSLCLAANSGRLTRVKGDTGRGRGGGEGVRG